jgi:hypothetical protein
MDDTKMEALRLILRELAEYLREQHQVITNQTTAIGAIRQAFEGDSALSKLYRDSLRDLIYDETIRPNLVRSQVFETLVKKLSEW